MPPKKDDELPRSEVLRSISLSACAVIVVLVILSTVGGLIGKSPLVIAASAAALAVSVFGLAWVIVIGTETTAQTVAALTVIGLSGAVQVAFLPEEGGYLPSSSWR